MTRNGTERKNEGSSLMNQGVDTVFGYPAALSLRLCMTRCSNKQHQTRAGAHAGRACMRRRAIARFDRETGVVLVDLWPRAPNAVTV